MGAAANIQTTTSDFRVGRRIHCILYGGKNGTITAVYGQPGQGNSRAMLGGAMQMVTGPEAEIDVVWDGGSVSRRIPECIATGVQWRFLDEPDYTNAEIFEAVQFAKDEAARAEAEKQAKAEAFDAAVARYRTSDEFKHFEQTPDGYARLGDMTKLAAKNVRKHLKATFPGVKFSVRKHSCDALWVSWSREDDGETVNQRTVRDALQMFKTGHYDAIEDYHSSSNSPFNVVYGGVDYLTCQRSF